MRYFIGLMSGTSMDGVDAVLCAIDTHKPMDTHWFQTLKRVSLPFPDSLLNTLNTLCQPSVNEINKMGAADIGVARLFAQAVGVLIEEAGLTPNDITALGSHGQTIRHHPAGYCAETANVGFTLQIGDPNTLAVLTGIPVVADFRRKDVALGGQGAPLVPAFHQAIFGCHDSYRNPAVPASKKDFSLDTHQSQTKAIGAFARAIVNIGGIANISFIDDSPSSISGFDSGPGNILMDGWVSEHLQLPFDKSGKWAASGTVHQTLLDACLNDPYFKQAAPKSTGREYFNTLWVSRVLQTFTDITPADVQATLCELTAAHIADAVKMQPRVEQVYICGGGAYNTHLLSRIQALLPAQKVMTTQTLGICPQDVEGAAFAWLAYAYLERITANVPAVTGACRNAVLGGLYLPD
ncbi:anhydro-N-acetylmuramic acid kinase [Salinimonas marina]|uniref:Anhydro-N-acetylmuramic acid kinase n=1 Tax=Salinimonas marina TaxID=2785918 RepID=A0A7S9HDR7_9ALTE|nr:anhydro-N-acetylmuramic acid kinase [Salinimonas marina]QPG06217.1 anhydro-N-acetylmuramic acid kinase [Salinimonas marina]